MSSAGVHPSTERGTHALAHGGVRCGEERWSLERQRRPDGRTMRIGRGVQEARAPHPFPSRIEWTASVHEDGRVESLEIAWQVGARRLESRHVSSGTRWQVTIDVDGRTRMQEGDYPAGCAVLFGTPLFHQWLFEGLALAPGAGHVAPALVIGPPWMAVEPANLGVRCTHAAERDTALGRRRLRRIELGDLARPEAEPLSLWIDDADRVVESYEGVSEQAPWMTLVEWAAPDGAAP